MFAHEPETHPGPRNCLLTHNIPGGQVVAEQSAPVAVTPHAQQPVAGEHDPQFLAGQAPPISPQIAEQSVVASHS